MATLPLLSLHSILTTPIEPDVVLNLFKNKVANCSKETVVDYSIGQKRLRLESEVGKVKRRTKTKASGPTIDKSTNTWVTAVKYLQCVLLTHRTGPHSKETQESWWNLIALEDGWPFDISGSMHFTLFFLKLFNNVLNIRLN